MIADRVFFSRFVLLFFGCFVVLDSVDAVFSRFLFCGRREQPPSRGLVESPRPHRAIYKEFSVGSGEQQRLDSENDPNVNESDGLLVESVDNAESSTDVMLSYLDTKAIALDMWNILCEDFDFMAQEWKHTDLNLMLAHVRLHIYQAMERKADSLVPFFPSPEVPSEVPRKTLYKNAKFLSYGYSSVVWRVVSDYVQQPVAAKIMSPFAHSRLKGRYVPMPSWTFTNTNDTDIMNNEKSVFSLHALSEIVASVVARKQSMTRSSKYLVQPFGVFVSTGLGIDLVQRDIEKVPENMQNVAREFNLYRQVVRTRGPNEALRVHLWMELLDITYNERSRTWKEVNGNHLDLNNGIDFRSAFFEILWGEYSLFTKEGIIIRDRKLDQFGFKYSHKRRVYSVEKQVFVVKCPFMPRRFDLGSWTAVNAKDYPHHEFLLKPIVDWYQFASEMQWKAAPLTDNAAYDIYPGRDAFLLPIRDLVRSVENSRWHRSSRPDTSNFARVMLGSRLFRPFLSATPADDIKSCLRDSADCELFVM